MTNRFRVSSTLPRKLEELGLSPGTVLRKAGLPIGLFNPDRILVSTEEFFALHRGIAEASSDPLVGLKLGTEERVSGTTRSGSLRSPRGRFKTRSSGCRGISSSPVRKKSVPSNGGMNALSSLFGFSRMRRSLHCSWMCVSRGSSLWRTGVLDALSVQACGVSTNSGTPRNVRSSFPLSNKVQGQPERLDIQQGGHGIAICDL